MYDHHIITRYNLQLYKLNRKANGITIKPDQWMSHRLPIFTKFCYSSITNQTCQNFKWIILCDEDTPQTDRSHLEQVIKHSNIDILYISTTTDDIKPVITQTLLHKYGSKPRLLTRLDNDDSLSTDFVETIQQCANNYWNIKDMILANRAVIDCPYGFITDTSQSVYKKIITGNKGASNHVSMISENNDLYSYRHFHIYKYKRPIHTYDINKPMWLRIIHGKNLGNRMVTDDSDRCLGVVDKLPNTFIS